MLTETQFEVIGFDKSNHLQFRKVFDSRREAIKLCKAISKDYYHVEVNKIRTDDEWCELVTSYEKGRKTA